MRTHGQKEGKLSDATIHRILCSEFMWVLDSCTAFCSYAGLGCSKIENHEDSWFATDVAGSTVR
jgi:hypothetical protein